jgi:hypothetical protein
VDLANSGLRARTSVCCVCGKAGSKAKSSTTRKEAEAERKRRNKRELRITHHTASRHQHTAVRMQHQRHLLSGRARRRMSAALTALRISRVHDSTVVVVVFVLLFVLWFPLNLYLHTRALHTHVGPVRSKFQRADSGGGSGHNAAAAVGSDGEPPVGGAGAMPALPSSTERRPTAVQQPTGDDRVRSAVLAGAQGTADYTFVILSDQGSQDAKAVPTPIAREVAARPAGAAHRSVARAMQSHPLIGTAGERPAAQQEAGAGKADHGGVEATLGALENGAPTASDHRDRNAGPPVQPNAPHARLVAEIAESKPQETREPWQRLLRGVPHLGRCVVCNPCWLCTSGGCPCGGCTCVWME